MTEISTQALLNALRGVRVSPDGPDIVARGMVPQGALRVEKGAVSFVLSLPPDLSLKDGESLRLRAESALAALPGVSSVRALITSEKTPDPVSSSGPVARHVVAISSGKGGVGKSTVAVNLSVSLAARGLKIGLLDADIHGPSLPRLLGLNGFRPVRENGRIFPAQAFGLRAMSIGFMLPEDGPVVWRGPMVQSAILQMLREVDWDMPDILLIDMPPGTGDAQIALAQRAGLAGAVIVSTPQDVALADARKGLETFRKLDVPIIGIIENMSVFICPCCAAPTPIFGEGGGAREADRLGVPFLGALPILPEICASSDSGKPITATQPENPAAQAFGNMAEKIQIFCNLETKKPSMPPRAAS